MSNQPKAGTVSIYVSGVPTELRDKVKELAREAGTSASEIARDAWQAYVEKHSKKKGA